MFFFFALIDSKLIVSQIKRFLNNLNDLVNSKLVVFLEIQVKLIIKI